MTDSELSSEDVFDVEKLREFVELMQEYDLSEIDLRQDDLRIRVRRGAEPLQPVAAAAPPTLPVAPSATSSQPAEEDNKNVVLIKSPMVGTFYSKPNPKAETYIKVGDHIGPETIVCTVEAMKVFNEIQAETSGQIIAVLVENEDPVEFGKPLFKVDTSK